MTQRVMWMMILAYGSLMGCTTPVSYAPSNTPTAVEPVATKAKLKSLGLQYYWKGKVPLQPAEIITKMWAVDDLIYFLTNQRNLYAFNARVGVPMWAVNVTSKPEPIYAPTHYRGMQLTKEVGGVKEIQTPPSPEKIKSIDATLINTATRVVVIDGKGKVWRDFSYRNFSAGAKAATNGWNIYVPTPTKLAYCVRLNEAVTCWWRSINGGEMIKAPMIVYDKNVFIGTMDGTVKLMDTETGGHTWRKTLPGTIDTPFHVDGRGIFVACGDRNIHGLNFSGVALWYPCTFDSEFVGPMRATDRSLLQRTLGEGLCCVNVTTGKLRWSNTKLVKPVALIEGKMFCLDTAGNIQAINEITGKATITIPATGFDFVGTNLRAKSIYGATSNGIVYCIRHEDAGILTSEEFQRQ